MVNGSGELLGNLYTRGMAWSAMPFKGRIFFSDTNSGLWSARLVPRTRRIS